MEVVVATDVVVTLATNMAVVDMVVVTELVVVRILKRELERAETPVIQNICALFGTARSTNSKSCVLVSNMHLSLSTDWDSHYGSFSI